MARKEHCYEYPRPALTVDAVVFREDGGETKILLVRRANEPFKGRWALPGGFVDEMEPLLDAVKRELKEETGVTATRFEQLGAYGDPSRDPRGRTVSIVYTAEAKSGKATAGDDAGDAKWFDLEKLPRLAFDHKKIVRDAVSARTSCN